MELLPEYKLNTIVSFILDVINDTPVLTTGNLGVAHGISGIIKIYYVELLSEQISIVSVFTISHIHF
ncbi:hypothetical protein JM658_16140 [Joostella atrarenae]|uniref:Uncharacterized protein n=1 Tax=Joostella atrarenae TaxID=679257 RepID=A0ABS9J7F9_9FLAO|nr:hypothetical protein [Joostella atrarenae]MCF8716361.1 hypothetical protein [Joostella atrarenae]